MVVAATFMVTARLTGIAVRDHWRRPAAVDVAVVSGAGVVGSIVFRVGALIFDVRNLVAYGGITIGEAMTASTLTGRRCAGVGSRRGSLGGRSSRRPGLAADAAVGPGDRHDAGRRGPRSAGALLLISAVLPASRPRRADGGRVPYPVAQPLRRRALKTS